MREIEFRGKRKDTGEWVYGYFIKDDNNKCYIFPNYAVVCKCIFPVLNKSINSGLFEVLPETVGQYTGVRDVNWKKIYERSKLKLNHGKNYTVVFVNGAFRVGETSTELTQGLVAQYEIEVVR